MYHNAIWSLLGKNGKTQNIEKAIGLLQKASEKGCLDSKYILGIIEKCDDVQKCVEFLIEQGLRDSRSLGIAGMLMGYGDERRIETLKKAAEMESGLAQSELGHCYYFGGGVEEDDDKAVLWYERASNNNDPDGLYRLGGCYYNGLCLLDIDEEKGLLLYERSACLGWRDAQAG